MATAATEPGSAHTCGNSLDPVIHVPHGCAYGDLAACRGRRPVLTRLQDLIKLTPGNLITHLRKLQDAGYATTQRNGSGVTARTSVTVTHAGRAALEHYTTVLRKLLDTATAGSPTLPGQNMPTR